MKHKALSNKNGFTLLEVLVAMAILGVGIMAVMGLFPASLGHARAAAEKSDAANAAASELSRVRALDNLAEIRSWLGAVTAGNMKQTAAVYALYDETQAIFSRIPGSDDLFRITYRVKTSDNNYETFVTYVTER